MSPISVQSDVKIVKPTKIYGFLDLVIEMTLLGMIGLLVLIVVYKSQSVPGLILAGQPACVSKLVAQQLLLGEVVKVRHLDRFKSECSLSNENSERRAIVERQLKAMQSATKTSR